MAEITPGAIIGIVLVIVLVILLIGLARDAIKAIRKKEKHNNNG